MYAGREPLRRIVDKSDQATGTAGTGTRLLVLWMVLAFTWAPSACARSLLQML